MKKTFLRKLIKFSHYSTCLTLPKSATEALNWDSGTELEIKLDSKRKRLIVNLATVNSHIPSDKLPDPITLALEGEKISVPLVTRRETEKITKKSHTKESGDDLLPLEEL